MLTYHICLYTVTVVFHNSIQQNIVFKHMTHFVRVCFDVSIINLSFVSSRRMYTNLHEVVSVEGGVRVANIFGICATSRHHN